MPTDFRVRFFASLVFSLGLAFSAGCSSDSRSDDPARLNATPPIYPPSMAGSENFAEGNLAVRVTLGLSTGERHGKERGERNSSESGATHHGGGGHHHGGMGSGSEGPAPESSGYSNDRPVAMSSNLPPAQLKIELQNTSATDPISCEVVDFKSALGDFAVFPSRYQIEPGQTAASEIMTSRLGVEGSDIPVTVELRIRGRVEKKVIILHLIPKPDQPPAAEPGK